MNIFMVEICFFINSGIEGRSICHLLFKIEKVNINALYNICLKKSNKKILHDW